MHLLRQLLILLVVQALSYTQVRRLGQMVGITVSLITGLLVMLLVRLYFNSKKKDSSEPRDST
jgi:hypothetical protein